MDTQRPPPWATLKDYAEAISIGCHRLRDVHNTATAWEERDRSRSVPWTCFYMCYADKNRREIVASFIAKCEAEGVKPRGPRQLARREAVRPAGAVLGRMGGRFLLRATTPGWG
jgi:hypothetical protein